MTRYRPERHWAYITAGLIALASPYIIRPLYGPAWSMTTGLATIMTWCIGMNLRRIRYRANM